MLTTSILAAAGFAATVSAHGLLVSPPPRQPGAANKAACGAQASYMDKNGNVQGYLNVARQQSDYRVSECRMWQCKGWKYEDNTANVQRYTAGQVVPMTFNIAAPHTGVANVSIVDVASDTIIGSPLKSWDDFASNAHTIPEDQKTFSITIPNLGGKCATAGECVIQHYWDAANIDQTYESCVDFVVGGGSGSAPAPAPSSSAAPATTAAPSSTLVTVSKVAEPTTSSAAAPQPTASSPAPGAGSTKPLPEGTTLADILAWIKILLNQ